MKIVIHFYLIGVLVSFIIAILFCIINRKTITKEISNGENKSDIIYFILISPLFSWFSAYEILKTEISIIKDLFNYHLKMKIIETCNEMFEEAKKQEQKE